MVEVIVSSRAPAAIGPYSQAVHFKEFIFCSGQIGLDPVKGVLVEGVGAQTEQALKNLRSILAEAGAGLKDIVKTTVYLCKLEDFEKMNSVYSRYFTVHKPARSTVVVSNLPKGALVEIDAIAVQR